MIERQLVAVLRDKEEERLTTLEKRGVFISHAPFEPEASKSSARRILLLPLLPLPTTFDTIPASAILSSTIATTPPRAFPGEC